MKTLQDYGIRCDSGVGQHYTQCPECSAKRKNKRAACLSVKIEAESSVWFCHHCGWTGSLFDGVNNRSNPNGWKTDEWTRPKLTGVGQWREEQIKHFAARGISQAMLERNRVTVERVWIPQVEDFEDAVAFPFYRNGELINIKYRGKNKHFRMATNAEKIFYGLDDIVASIGEGGELEIVPQEIAFIVEGEMDKLAMDVAGFPNTLSTPNGAPPATAKDLDRYFDFIRASNYKLHEQDEEGLLDQIGTFYIAVDSDGPGQKLEEELIRRLGPERCVRVQWPRLPLDREAVTLWDRTKVEPGDRLKDANEVLFCMGASAVQEAIRSARSAPIDGVYTVDDVSDELDDYFENGLPPGISVGTNAFKDKDGRHCLQVQTKMTWVVTGVPGHGKSRWVENIEIDLAKNAGWRIAHFSPEVRPLQLMISYFMAQYKGIPFEKGWTKRMTREEYLDAKSFVREHFFFMESGILPFSVDDLLDRCTRLVKREGIRAVVFDPWNNIYHSRKHNEREDEYIGQALQKINAWRNRYDVWVAIVAHPTKLPLHNGQEPVATLNDIKGGAEWYSMADFGFSVWRNKSEEGQPAQVYVQKTKFHHLATLGRAQVKFDKPTGRFLDAGEPYGPVVSRQISRAGEPSGHAPPPWMQGREWE